MTPRQIIEKKQSGEPLSPAEIRYFIEGYTGNTIPDYQAAALLMAIYFQGMTVEETVELTRAMLESGDRVDFSGVPGKRVDKHSTGGVGDKISLTLAPTVAACGGQVPMISGRGLGHTGGTLDKLESIPGFSVRMSAKEIRDNTLKIGAALAGQNDRVVPADMKMYALRDVTGTVKSIPLITASIISKKAAEGIDALVLDVKCGGGAIFPERKNMEKLARNLVDVGNGFGMETMALLTDMSQPLGYAVGNWLETRECIQIMQWGTGAGDLIELNNALSGVMLCLCGITATVREGVEMAGEALVSQAALRKFREIVANQKGDVSVIDHPDEYPAPEFSRDISAQESGFIHDIKARTVGEQSLLLGAGRKSKEDEIDYTAGVVFAKRRGDFVHEGDLLAKLYSNSQAKLEEVSREFPKVFTLGDEKPRRQPLIEKVFTKDGATTWKDYRG